MAEKSERNVYANSYLRVVPFTGPLFAIWAFFSPEGFGTWFGQIVRAFRTAAGF